MTGGGTEYLRKSLGGLSWLEHRLLNEQGVRHAFFDRSASFPRGAMSEALFGRVSEALKLDTLKLDTLGLAAQVHGAEVLDASGDHPPGSLEIGRGDGLVLKGRGAIGVVTADCVPVLIAGKGSVAAVHAGWRGLAAGVVENTVAELTKRGENPAKLVAVIGPCAGRDRYEVGGEVIEALGPIQSARPKGDKFLLDLVETARLRLLDSGVSSIGAVELCTIADEQFNSYRRQGSAAGRNLSVIVAPVLG